MGTFFNDLTNNRFGRLVALSLVSKDTDGSFIWLCLCDCGNTKEILNRSLLNGNTKSCGCLAKETCTKDILYKTFGRLTVIEKTNKRICKSIVWKCQCSCGNIKEISSTNLVNKGTKSCGCIKKEQNFELRSNSLLNQRFGRLTVIGKTNNLIGNSIVWKCLCDCGTTKFVARTHLSDGHTKSCGCLNSELSKNRHKQYRLFKGKDPDIHLSSLDEQIRGVFSNSGLKQKTLQRDNYKCVLCRHSKELAIHHIVPKQEDETKFFDSNNLITLCKSCHLLSHAGNYKRVDKTIQTILGYSIYFSLELIPDSTKS